MSSRLIFLPGLNGDPRVFRELLRHFPDADVIRWIPPHRREAISSYASRLAETLGELKGATVVGVSFGGIIAQELAAKMGSVSCLVISSIRGPEQLPGHYRAARYLGLGVVEKGISLAAGLNDSIQTVSEQRPIKRRGAAFRSWAIAAMVRWKPPNIPPQLNLVQIHGDQDATFPIRYVNPDVTIAGGGHLIALTHADQIAKVISILIE